MRRMALPFETCLLAIAIALACLLGGNAALAACSTSPRVGVDWTKCEKTRLNLSGRNLSDGIFVYTDFDGTDLKNAMLVGADLHEADLTNARLEGADLSNANLNKTHGDRTNFRKAKLRGADLTKSEMARADFTEADFSGAMMVKIEMGRANLSGAVLDDADLSRAEIARAVFKGAQLKGTNFYDAYTYLTHFEGTDLSQATGLVQQQINVACGDDQTVLPSDLERPSHWPCGQR